MKAREESHSVATAHVQESRSGGLGKTVSYQPGSLATAGALAVQLLVFCNDA